VTERTCPTCGLALDPLRAPVARVVAGRIETFCSRDCAAGMVPVRAARPGADPARPGPARPAAERPLRPGAERPARPAAERPARPGAAPPAPAFTPPAGPAAPPGPVEVVVAPAGALDDEDEPRREIDRRRRRNRRVAWLTAGIVAGGMAVVVIQAVSPSTPARVAAARDGSPSAEREAPAPGDGMPQLEALEAAAVRERAIGELRALMTVPERGRVPRIAREAAAALSRTGDREALDVLARALADEPSELARLEVAYALARGSDPRGLAALVAALSSSRRDVKADAARHLVLLGDKRGFATLERKLALAQTRLGAAEALAPAANRRGIAILESVRHDGRSSREDQLRALVALGRAGRADVAEELRAVLGDRQFNVGAAEALARLRDPAAAPVLAEHLAVPSLRIGAALGLRRLDPDLDPDPFLPGLVAALDSGKDTARVSAAEAILVLTGPAELAERD
jgi:HEAT repeat protein